MKKGKKVKQNFLSLNNFFIKKFVIRNVVALDMRRGLKIPGAFSKLVMLKNNTKEYNRRKKKKLRRE